MDQRLDIETERGTDAHDVFAIDTLEDRRLSRIVETAFETRKE
jgi:hypothetical protein